MKIAFCYETVVPSRGGCELYIGALARRLLADGHEVRLYASRWDEPALPPGIRYYPLPARKVLRVIRPWRFGGLCQRALAEGDHDLSIGFDKTLGVDVMYPQGGLHPASVKYNLNKYRSPLVRHLAHIGRHFDPAHWSFLLHERRQYLGKDRPVLIVNSEMVRRHFWEYYGIAADQVHVIPSAIEPERFDEHDRPRRRLELRRKYNLAPSDTVATFAAMNYRLKGLAPLLRAVRRLCRDPQYQPLASSFHLLVAGNPEYQSYERLAQRLGVADRVRFLGYRPDMRDCYFAADFAVAPTFYDTCALVVLEAMTCGLPMITTRSSGASEFLHPLQEGYVLDDAHDDERMAWCMAQLLDPGRRSAFGQAARRTASQWTFEHHYREIMRVLDLAAARKRAA